MAIYLDETILIFNTQYVERHVIYAEGLWLAHLNPQRLVVLTVERGMCTTLMHDLEGNSTKITYFKQHYTINTLDKYFSKKVILYGYAKTSACVRLFLKKIITTTTKILFHPKPHFKRDEWQV